MPPLVLPLTLYIQIAVKIKLPILNKNIPETKTQIYEGTEQPAGTDTESMKSDINVS